MREKKFHYAWIVCFCCVLIFFCIGGLSCNVFSVYQPFIMQKYGYSKTALSLFVTIRTFSQIISLMWLGRYYQRMTLRNGMTLSAFITIAGYVVYGFSTQYYQFVIGSVLVGFGYGCASIVPISMVLDRWFKRDRTLAVSICSAASGLATIGIPGIITFLVENFGLHTAFLIEAGFMTLLVLLSYLFLRNDPEEKNIRAFGEEENRAAESWSAWKKTAEVSISKKKEVLTYVMALLCGASISTGWANQSMLAVTEGYSSSQMAFGVTLMGTSLMLGKFFCGLLSEKFTKRSVSAVFSVFLFLGVFCLTRAASGLWVFYLGSILFGFFAGNISIGLVSWAEDWFSPETRNAVKKRYQILYSTGGLLYTPISGMLADLMGGSYLLSYRIILLFILFIAFTVEGTYRSALKIRRAV